MVPKVKQGNSFPVRFTVIEGGAQKDMRGTADLVWRLRHAEYGCRRMPGLTFVGGENPYTVIVRTTAECPPGLYYLALSYVEGDEARTVDAAAFQLTAHSSPCACHDPDKQICLVAESCIGLVGASAYELFRKYNPSSPLTEEEYAEASVEAAAKGYEAIEKIEQTEREVAAAENTREQNEQGRVAAELSRVEAEQGRDAAELVRERSEAGRLAAEQERVAAEAFRIGAEQARADAEAGREGAEQVRVAAETTRVAAEEKRVSGEEQRQTAETERIDAETARAAAEQERISSEETRLGDEQARTEAETGRIAAELGRVADEQARVAAETTRIAVEQRRETGEAAREKAEETRVADETARSEAEAVRISAEAGRIAAEQKRETEETARAAAEAARVGDEQARVAGEVERIAAEQGRVTAEQGRVVDEQGRVTAEQGRIAAEQKREETFVAINEELSQTVRLGAEVGASNTPPPVPDAEDVVTEILAHADCTLEQRIAHLERLLVSVLSGKALIPELQVGKLGVWGDNNLIVAGAGAPSRQPDRAGQLWVDTKNDALYHAVANGAVSDWKTN